MLKLQPFQRSLECIYRTGVRESVDDFVADLECDDPHAHRREVVIVREAIDADQPVEIELRLDARVLRALQGGIEPTLSRFNAWCLALEGVSHFVLLAHRAANDRTVSQLELELQAEVDKFVVSVIQRRQTQGSVALRWSSAMERALFSAPRFLDDAQTPEGRRYRTAHRLAQRYVQALVSRFVSTGRLELLLEELRDFYRATWPTKRSMAEAA